MNTNGTTLQTLGRYPVGESSFAEIRKNGNVYVDKTEFIYQLTHDSKYYFLSRPRRFGKSLMLSTLDAYFEGKKELFEGLAISKLEKDWKRYPVINLTFGGEDFESVDILKAHLNYIVSRCESAFKIEPAGETPASRFRFLIENASKKFGEGVVILIDEYDKAMLDTRHRGDDLHSGVKHLLRGFFGVIKESAQYIRFVMITGVTKFNHVNIFSGLNNLSDISLVPKYNALCGISESEMKKYFSEDMKVFAEKNGMTAEEAALEFRYRYDGYRFASMGENIYNPFSTLLAFQWMTFDDYWFKSGTSLHLIEDLKLHHFDFKDLENIRATPNQLMQEPVISQKPIALLYQSGYLTIKDYKDGFYYLGFPNKEVQSGFYEDLLQIIVPVDKSDFSARLLALYAKEGNVKAMMEMLQFGLSKFTNQEMQKVELEYHLKIILKALLMTAELGVEGEVATPAGRIDMVLTTKDYIYLFEFKINSTAKKALAQIDEKDYPFHFYGDPRKLIKIGTSYSTRYRRLTSWVQSPVDKLEPESDK